MIRDLAYTNKHQDIFRTIIFRADGNPKIGMGHFIRTLALAEMTNDHFHCIFATRTPTEYQINEIEKVCHCRIDLPEDASHFDLFLNQLKGDEIVVLDNYYFDTVYQRKIKAKGCKLVCIDDMHDKHYVADVVINHAEGIKASAFSVEKNTQLLLGFKYALIRKPFREEQNSEGPKDYSCLLIMGGADPKGITKQIIKYLGKINFDKPVAVVSGNANFDRGISENSGKFVFFQNLDAAGIANLMKSSYVGIFPASTVAIEACAMKIPFICGFFVDNQTDIYRGIKVNEMAICLDDFTEITESQITDSITEISISHVRNAILEKQTMYMDNRSDKRFLKIFSEL
ncbi:MAG: UDP-2,4-diacetamido-2,4,6-trideoxy-beta-L-altropyranose hydrolase [bacterium]